MASLSKANYEEIAHAVGIERRAVGANAKEGYSKDEVIEMLDAISTRLGRAMTGTNPRFNHQHFLAACGVEPRTAETR